MSPLKRHYSALEAAHALRCSEWWLKEQARRRRIPFSMLGGSYRFAAAHLAEILAMFEVRPTSPGSATSADPEMTARSPRADPPDGAAPSLRSRRPRRVRRATMPSSAA